MTDEQTKQAILGFTEFFKGITGNQDLEIPSDIAEKFGIEKQEPSGDNVSRQAVIDVIDNWVKKYGILAIIPTDEVTPLFDSIHKLHSVNPQKWIPVSERLPEANEYIVDVARYYLVQNEYGDMLVARYRGEYWVQMYQLKPIADKIVAWCELPQPYEPQENGVCGMISDKLTTDDGEPDGTGGQIFCP